MVEAGRGADLFVIRFDQIPCSASPPARRESSGGWGGSVDSIRIQIGNRNKIYLSKHKLQKYGIIAWPSLFEQARPTCLGRMCLGGRLIVFFPKHALAQPAYNSCNSLPLLMGWSEAGE